VDTASLCVTAVGCAVVLVVAICNSEVLEHTTGLWFAAVVSASIGVIARSRGLRGTTSLWSVGGIAKVVRAKVAVIAINIFDNALSIGRVAL